MSVKSKSGTCFQAASSNSSETTDRAYETSSSPAGRRAVTSLRPPTRQLRRPSSGHQEPAAIDEAIRQVLERDRLVGRHAARPPRIVRQGDTDGEQLFEAARDAGDAPTFRDADLVATLGDPRDLGRPMDPVAPGAIEEAHDEASVVDTLEPAPSDGVVGLPGLLRLRCCARGGPARRDRTPDAPQSCGSPSLRGRARRYQGSSWFLLIGPGLATVSEDRLVSVGDPGVSARLDKAIATIPAGTSGASAAPTRAGVCSKTTPQCRVTGPGPPD